MAAQFSSISEIYDSLNSLGKHEGDTFTLTNKKDFQESFIDKLIYTGVFSDDEEIKNGARTLIHALAKDLGVKPSSHYTLYQAIGKGEVTGFTVPAFNIRVMTYDSCRVLFRLAKKENIGAFIIEIARSEMGYSDQNPSEFSSSVLAAAIKEEYSGHVFLQGDHYQVNADTFANDPEKEIGELKSLIADSIQAEMLNIDIDASTLVNLHEESIDKQQEQNARITAELTNFIRTNQPEGTTISIGGEIGHIGDRNSTPEDFTAFMTQYLSQIQGSGISKVSAQTGSSHGGTIDASGHIQEATIDFSIIEQIGSLAKASYSMGGFVQHGASTLPVELYPKFVEMKTLEIHLSTQFQNIVFDAMPHSLLEEIRGWTNEHCADERKPDWNDVQFFYKTRKKAIGPFKKQLWELSDTDKQPILSALEKAYENVFNKLCVLNTKDSISKYL